MVNVGDVLAGKYRVDKILGIGGMGMVVAATHQELGQQVAIKFMLADATAASEATERFMREARACVRLRSEHVCKVFDVGKLDTGAPYIVMEYLAGQDFQASIKRRAPLPLAEAVNHVLQAIEGVAEAHANGIVHRDLKPANLFVTVEADGSPLVKVLDFGISKLAGATSTKTGEMMGSPAYMAPEQMQSAKDVDARADQWALGVILYQAVTNKVPFAADSLPILCMQVMNDPAPSLAAQRADLPPGFVAAVERCLAKDPAARFADVAALADAIAPFGSPDAATAAKKIGKVLRRSGPISVEPSPAASGSAIAATMAPTDPTVMPSGSAPAVPAVEKSVDRSSVTGAAGELVTPPPRRRLGIVLGLGGALAAAVIVFVTMSSGKSDTQPQPPPVATQPPPQQPAPAPPSPPPAAPDPQPIVTPTNHAGTESPPPPAPPPSTPEPEKVTHQGGMHPTRQAPHGLKAGTRPPVKEAVKEPPKEPAKPPPPEPGSALRALDTLAPLPADQQKPKPKDPPCYVNCDLGDRDARGCCRINPQQNSGAGTQSLGRQH